MDSITQARQAMEAADDAFTQAEAAGDGHAALDELAQRVADAEAAYYRACDTWEPDLDGYDRNGAFDGFQVYSDADPGL